MLQQCMKERNNVSKIHEEKMKMKCEICNNSFGEKRTLIKHVASVPKGDKNQNKPHCLGRYIKENEMICGKDYVFLNAYTMGN